MLPYAIAAPATISRTTILNMAYLMSATTTKEFTESTCNTMTASTQYQQQQPSAITRSVGEGGVRN
ncbi:MAG TPA: hypothetical protein VJ695_09850 [Nitrososphaera sp.]|nr:hypothetical protein [Nitrososphaera sp.]